MTVKQLIEELKTCQEDFEIDIQEDTNKKEIVRITDDFILQRCMIFLKESEVDYDANGNKI